MNENPDVHILLVEDNRADADLVCEIVAEKFMATITVARDGEQAMSVLRSEDTPRPDLILLDLNIPKMHGLQVLREIKSDQDLKRIPVLIFTSSDAEADVLESYELNANCYVRKPVSLDRISDFLNLLNEFWIKAAKLPPKEWSRPRE